MWTLGGTAASSVLSRPTMDFGSFVEGEDPVAQLLGRTTRKGGGRAARAKRTQRRMEQLAQQLLRESTVRPSLAV